VGVISVDLFMNGCNVTHPQLTTTSLCKYHKQLQILHKWSNFCASLTVWAENNFRQECDCVRRRWNLRVWKPHKVIQLMTRLQLGDLKIGIITRKH